LMNRQLDAVAASYLQKAIEKRGVTVITGRSPVTIAGSARASGVVLDDGTMLATELVVAATGITPVTDIATQAGLSVNRGIVVDKQLGTSDRAIFAIGECCEMNGETVGLVAPIWQQVDVLAANLCGEAKCFEEKPYVTMLKVSGIDVHVMGEHNVAGDARLLTYQDRDHGIYKKLIIRNNAVIGALLFGDIADSQLFFNLIQNQIHVGSNDCRLLLAGELPTQQILASA
jgi:nitrite reductase (NADH) large subunit